MRIIAFAAASLVAASAALAQTTAFTYQGELKNSGSPANGLYDFRFRLFDDAVSGNLIGSSFCVDNVQVTNGRFTTILDFGQQFATTSARLLDIQVRQDTGQDCSQAAGFTQLSPRQPIAPTPRATAANVANALSAPDGAPANAVVVDNAGHVGIGTSTPAFPIHVASTFAVLGLQDTGPNNTQAGYISYRNGTGTETGWIGYGSAGDTDLSIVNARTGGDIVLNPISGNVGVGTASPTAKLEVRGEIRYGTTGQFRPAAGEEPLRIIRGKFSSTGVILLGQGFTVANPSTGVYDVTFSTPFTGTPVVTTSLDAVSGNVWPFSSSTSTISFRTFDGSSALAPRGIEFIAIGPR